MANEMSMFDYCQELVELGCTMEEALKIYFAELAEEMG